ncbi:MAG: hypothetical protein JNM21_11715 [Taibaiella sp.]|nr:hypothetical protein [Taibaiella sp.]
MEFDFYTKYQQLDTEHLLSLVATPEKIQAAAMEAALKVLAERAVTEQEISERKSLHQAAVIAEEEVQRSRKKTKIFDYLEKTFFARSQNWDFDEEEPVLGFTEEENKSIIHYLLWILLAPLLQAIVIVVGICSVVLIAIEYQMLEAILTFSLPLMLLSLCLVIFIAISFVKRKKNAWSAMLIYTIYYIGNYLFTLYKISAPGFEASYYNLTIYFVMIPLGIYTVFVLNKKLLLNAFEISKKRIENTWAIAILFPVVLFFIMYLYS